MIKTKVPEKLPGFITRSGLSDRWKCHSETLRRMERKGLLHPLELGQRMVRYDLAEIYKIEEAAR